MTKHLDEDAQQRASKFADERWPVPTDTPGGAAFHAVMVSTMIVGAFGYLSTLVGYTWAGIITVTLSGLVSWSDCRSAYRRHSREYLDLYKLFAEQNERERQRHVERES